MAGKKSKIDTWLEKETSHKQKALENASRYFDSKDALTVNILESIYGQESSFGDNRRQRGLTGAAGDFQIEKNTAVRFGLIVTKGNDQRFDIDDASRAAAQYLKGLDNAFRDGSKLGGDLKTIGISDPFERAKFTLAAYNGGEGRVAQAQLKAQADGKDPHKWDDVKNYLEVAGANPAKVSEIQKYVEEVLQNSKELSEKSKADKNAKERKPLKTKTNSPGGRWITKDSRHIPLGD